MLIFLGILLFLLHLITVFSIIKYFTYRRFSIRRNVYQIQICLLSKCKRFVEAKHSTHFSVLINYTNFRSANFLVDLCLLSIFSANSTYLHTLHKQQSAKKSADTKASAQHSLFIEPYQR